MLMHEQQAELVPATGRAAKATYRATAGNYLKFYNDGSEDGQGNVGAFADLEMAIRAAKHFIFIVDWSFHPKFTLRRRGDHEEAVGTILLNKAKAADEMLIAIMPWSHWVQATGDADNNNGLEALQELNGNAPLPPNLLWRISPYGSTDMWSHHQKFVVLDAPADENRPDGERVVKAFFGGLDITRGRFDWPEHPTLVPEDDPRPFTHDWYNGEFAQFAYEPDTMAVPLRQPWHDIHAQIVGPTAWDFVYEFVARWCKPDQYYRGMGPKGNNAPEDHDKVFDKLQALIAAGDGAPKLYQQAEEQPPLTPVDGPPLRRPWTAQLLHSINKVAWGTPQKLTALNKANGTPVTRRLQERLTWKLPEKYERSIQDAYLSLIAAAERFIYIESQYLIGSGARWQETRYDKARKGVANAVPEALVNRIKRAIQAGQSFHVYIVLPMFPEGAPDKTMGTYEVRYLQWCTMEYMIREIYAACGDRWTDYLSFYCPAQWENTFAGAGQLPVVDGRPDWTQARIYPEDVVTRTEKLKRSKRYMIYVHSKFMLVDDKYAIIGSANLNERSLNGDRDSEICVAFWPTDPDSDVAPTKLGNFRKRVWAEHLGVAWMEATVAGDGTVPNEALDPGSVACARLVAAAGEQNFLNFMRGMRAPGEHGHLLRWPLTCTNEGIALVSDLQAQIPSDYIPDYPEEGKQWWKWVADWTKYSQNWITGPIFE